MAVDVRIREGDVVFSGRGYFVALSRVNGRVLTCPLVSAVECRHRADIDVNWFDLSAAGLGNVNVRLRAVACLRNERRLTRVGYVGAALVECAMLGLKREYRQADRARI